MTFIKGYDDLFNRIAKRQTYTVCIAPSPETIRRGAVPLVGRLAHGALTPLLRVTCPGGIAGALFDAWAEWLTPPEGSADLEEMASRVRWARGSITTEEALRDIPPGTSLWVLASSSGELYAEWRAFAPDGGR